MNDMVRQEIHCHNCNRYVQFELDMSLNGNHVLDCPNCGHEHCRVVDDGQITGERWDSRNGDSGAVYYVSTSSASTSLTSIGTTFFQASTTTTAGAATSASFLADSWLQTTRR